MAGGAERGVVAGPFFVFWKILSGGGQCSGAEAGFAAEADAVRRRRIASREGVDCGEMRCVPDAWRCAGARAGENYGLARTSRAPQFASAEIWRGRLCDCARDGARGAGRVAPDYGCAAVGSGLRELPAVACRDAVRAARFARRLFRVESRAPLRACGYGGTSGRTRCAVRGRRRWLAAVTIQPTPRRAGELRGDRNSPP